jgi:hypothetical protein
MRVAAVDLPARVDLLVYVVNEAKVEFPATGVQTTDVAAVAAAIAASLDQEAPALVMRVLILIERAQLDAQEFQLLLELLTRRGMLAKFLDLSRFEDFRAMLRANDVPWEFVIENQYTPMDSAVFWVGFPLGIGQNILAVVDLLAALGSGIALAVNQITKDPYSDALAQKFRELMGGVKVVFSHPLVTGQAAINQFEGAFREAIWQLKFEEAGRLFGQALITIVTLPEMIKALPQLAKSAVKFAAAAGVLAARVVQATLAQLLALGDDVARALLVIARDLDQGLQPALATVGGYSISVVGDSLQVVGEASAPMQMPVTTFMTELKDKLAAIGFRISGGEGSPFRRVHPPIPMTDEDIDQALAALNKDKASEPGKLFPVVNIRELVDAVEEAVTLCIKKLEKKKAQGVSPFPAPDVWIPAKEYGSALHREFQAIVDEKELVYDIGVISEDAIRSEVPISKYPEVPDEIKEMTIDQFLASIASSPEDVRLAKAAFTREMPGEGLPRTIQERKIKELTPDLVVDIPGADTLLVWDLTSVQNEAHTFKTTFYQKVLNSGAKRALASETYYKHDFIITSVEKNFANLAPAKLDLKITQALTAWYAYLRENGVHMSIPDLIKAITD